MQSRLLQALVLAAFLSFALGGCDSPAPPSSSSLDAETARRLFEHIDELIVALRTRPSTAAHQVSTASIAPGEGSERTAADASLSTLQERVDALERHVAQLQFAGTAHAGTLARAVDAPTKVQVRVDQLIAQIADGRTSAAGRASLFMRSPAQVLDLLGLPDETEVGDGVITWNYRKGESRLNLQFHGGVVMRVVAW